MPHDLRLSSLFIGSLITAGGCSLVGVYTFKNRPLLVFTGFLLFVVGYKLSWYGTRLVRDTESLRGYISGGAGSFIAHIDQNFTNYLLVLMGLISTSYGATIFGQTVKHFSIYQGAISGFMCVIGYMLAHEGVNEVLI